MVMQKLYQWRSCFPKLGQIEGLKEKVFRKDNQNFSKDIKTEVGAILASVKLILPEEFWVGK